MPTINIRGLRDTRRLKAWLRAGKAAELRDRDTVIAHIVPVVTSAKARKIPDFAAMCREIFWGSAPSQSGLIDRRAGAITLSTLIKGSRNGRHRVALRASGWGKTLLVRGVLHAQPFDHVKVPAVPGYQSEILLYRGCCN
jgi:hypothetical protein